VPKITEEHYYDGARERITRLGLEPLIQELRAALRSFRLLVKEKRNSNGGAAVRRLLDQRFEQSWTKAKSGEIDWTQCHTVNGTRVCIGVEIQVSARSDLLVIDTSTFARLW
jgi:hypothetical protein